jgi:hypothetical protein
MATIFISYRREDAAGYAGRISDRFVQALGRDRVFLDVDRIDPGADFEQVIKDRLGQCAVFLAVIGPRWLEIGSGRRLPRIFEDRDFVRVELRTALASGARVIPVLVSGAPLPKAVELPMDIAELVRRQAVVLGDTDFHHDVGNLIDLVAGLVGVKVADPDAAAKADEPVTAPPPVSRTHPARRFDWWPTVWGVISALRQRNFRAAGLLLVMAGAGLFLWDWLSPAQREQLTAAVTGGKQLIGSVVAKAGETGNIGPLALPKPLPGPSPERAPPRAAVLDPYPVTVQEFADWLKQRGAERSADGSSPAVQVEEAVVEGVVGQILRDDSGPLAALYLKGHPVFAVGGVSPRGTGFEAVGRSGRPILAVTWHAADAYCRKQGKHLPTAAEWQRRGSAGGERPLRMGTAAREWVADLASGGRRQVVHNTPALVGQPPASAPADTMAGDIGFRCAR